MNAQSGEINTFDVSSDEIIREVGKLYTAKPNEYSLVSMIHSQGMKYEKGVKGVNAIGTPMGAEIVKNPKYEQHLDEIETDEDNINLAAGYADNITSIIVNTGALFSEGALVQVPRTGEIMRVTSISANTLTVTRGESGTTAAALVDNDLLIIMATAYAENADAGTPRFSQTSFSYNYLQIVRESFAESRTSAGTGYYNNAQSYEEEKKKKLVSMMRKFNGIAWNGGRSIDTTNKIRTTGGILEFIDSGNVMDVNQNLTRADFDYFLSSYAFNYNSNKKTLFAGKRLLNKIDGWYDAKLVLDREGPMLEFGFAVRTYKTRWGDLDIVWEPYFDKFEVGTHPLNGYGVVLDLSLVSMKYLSNGVLRSRDDIQGNGIDGRKGEWLMEAGVCVNIPKAHAVLRDV